MISTNSKRLNSYYNSIITQDFLLKTNCNSLFEIPCLEKIVLNASSSLYALDRKNLISPLLGFEFLTGQKAKFTCAKKSLASFKIRENQILGCKVTLRKKQLYKFLNIFTSIYLPRIRDFSGFLEKNTKNRSCFSFGISNVLTFPHLENHFEYFQNFRGFNLNITISKSHQKTLSLLLSAYQLPFQKSS